MGIKDIWVWNRSWQLKLDRTLGGSYLLRDIVYAILDVFIIALSPIIAMFLSRAVRKRRVNHAKN